MALYFLCFRLETSIRNNFNMVLSITRRKQAWRGVCLEKGYEIKHGGVPVRSFCGRYGSPSRGSVWPSTLLLIHPDPRRGAASPFKAEKHVKPSVVMCKLPFVQTDATVSTTSPGVSTSVWASLIVLTKSLILNIAPVVPESKHFGFWKSSRRPSKEKKSLFAGHCPSN